MKSVCQYCDEEIFLSEEGVWLDNYQFEPSICPTADAWPGHCHLPTSLPLPDFRDVAATDEWLRSEL